MQYNCRHRENGNGYVVPAENNGRSRYFTCPLTQSISQVIHLKSSPLRIFNEEVGRSPIQRAKKCGFSMHDLDQIAEIHASNGAMPRILLSFRGLLMYDADSTADKYSAAGVYCALISACQSAHLISNIGGNSMEREAKCWANKIFAQDILARPSSMNISSS